MTPYVILGSSGATGAIRSHELSWLPTESGVNFTQRLSQFEAFL